MSSDKCRVEEGRCESGGCGVGEEGVEKKKKSLSFRVGRRGLYRETQTEPSWHREQVINGIQASLGGR